MSRPDVPAGHERLEELGEYLLREHRADCRGIDHARLQGQGDQVKINGVFISIAQAARNGFI
jgi:hypothetical protein